MSNRKGNLSRGFLLHEDAQENISNVILVMLSEKAGEWWCWDEVTEKQERFEEGITHKALNRCKLTVEVLRNIPGSQQSPQSPADGSRGGTKGREEPTGAHGVMAKAKLPLGEHQAPML